MYNIILNYKDRLQPEAAHLPTAEYSSSCLRQWKRRRIIEGGTRQLGGVA